MEELIRGLDSMSLGASSLVNTSVVALVADQVPTVRDVRDALRRAGVKRSSGRTVYYYVTDAEGRLTGVIVTDKLLFADDDDELSKVMMTEVFALKAEDSASGAVNMLRLSTHRGLPVVKDGKLIGVLDWEHVYEKVRGQPLSMIEQAVAINELKREISRILGFDAAEMHGSSVRRAVALRAPPLLVTTSAGLICAFTIQRYEHLLSLWPVIAAFIPMVLALADAVSHQASTIAVVEDHGADRKWKKIFSGWWKESRVSFCIGSLALLLLLVMVAIWQWNFLPAVAIGLAVAAAVTVGGVVGFSVPVVLRLLRRDPHFSGGPIALALTDLAATILLLESGRFFLT